MKRVSELDGAELALWVALAIAKQGNAREKAFYGRARIVGGGVRFGMVDGLWAPHEDWSQGGPLIEKHMIGFGVPVTDAGLLVPGADYQAFLRKGSAMMVAYGPTHLIAAMRALVASVYGGEVES